MNWSLVVEVDAVNQVFPDMQGLTPMASAAHR